MHMPIRLPTVTFDLEEVSEIYDYGSYVLVNFHVFHDPIHLVLTGVNATALRATELVCYDLLADIKWHLQYSDLFSLISVQVIHEDGLVFAQCSVRISTTPATVVAQRLWNIWNELPLRTSDGRSERTLLVNRTCVRLEYETSLRYAAVARGRIEVIGFAET